MKGKALSEKLYYIPDVTAEEKIKATTEEKSIFRTWTVS